MQTFDQSLFYLFKDNLITYEEALSRATRPDDFALRVKGITSIKEVWDGDKEFLNEEQSPDIEGFSK